MKLISMTDFVLEQRLKYAESFKSKVYAYANFLKQPLTLGMFVPCDEDGNVLEEPLKEDYEIESDGFSIVYDAETYEYDLAMYREAKERVLFEHQDDFVSWDECDMRNEKIEDLLSDGYTYILTPSALKQIGL